MEDGALKMKGKLVKVTQTSSIHKVTTLKLLVVVPAIVVNQNQVSPNISIRVN